MWPAISLPCRPSVVSVPAAIGAVPPVSISGVEAGRGAIRIGTNTYCAALGCRRQVGFAIVKLSSVELVAVFVRWDVFGSHGQRGHFEVGVFQCIYGVDPSAPVQFEELS